MSNVSKLPPKGGVYVDPISIDTFVVTVKRFDNGEKLTVRLTGEETIGLATYLFILYAAMLVKSGNQKVIEQIENLFKSKKVD